MDKLYIIALGMVQGIGNIGSKRILAHTGSAEAVFRLDRRTLIKIPGVGSMLADRILDKSVIERAGKELEYIRINKIKCLFYPEENYPEKLRYCEDAPLVLYVRGTLDLAGKKILRVVGTRRPTSYGLEACRKLIRDLADRYSDLVVVSGLAYGIDHCAHKTALECGLETVAVLGHGLKFLYPSIHRHIAGKIELSGALATSKPDSFVYSSEEWVLLTPRVRYKPYDWLSIDLGIDLRMAPSDDRQWTSGVPDVSSKLDLPKNYPPWKVQMGLNFNIPVGGKSFKTLEEIESEDFNRRVEFYKLIQDEREKSSEIEDELKDLKREREAADKEIEELKKMLDEE